MKKVSRDRAIELVELAWLGLDESDDLSYVNPFDLMTRADKENPDLYLLSMMSDPHNFYLTCKLLLDIEINVQQAIALEEMWNHPFPMLICTRGWSKTFTMALYAVLRAIFLQGRKIVVTGAGFRQAKIFLSYVERIWHRAHVLKDIFAGSKPPSGPKHEQDRWSVIIGESVITGLPIGDGESIRGERANDTFSDEFNSLPQDIFERVVAGFGVVSDNPIENMKAHARAKSMLKYDMIDSAAAKKISLVSAPNQLVLSGTAGYDFQHFAKYYKRYKSIIESKGDENKLKALLDTKQEFVVPEGFDWSDYVVIKIPIDLVPEGMMSDAQVARHKMTMHNSMFMMEYGTVFCKDSDGFFKRTTIEGCVVSKENLPTLLECQHLKGLTEDELTFSAKIRGDSSKQYIFGLDPASQVDNFSISIIELHENHRRLVYAWTFSKMKHNELLKNNRIDENNYYAYCARKVRNLMKTFPCLYIALDAQGGGHQILEAFNDTDKLEGGELPLWPVKKEGKEQSTDMNAGLHIIHMCQNADINFLRDANHGLRKDFEDRVLLFPYVDSIELSIAGIEDEIHNREFDTLEDCVWEIEETKNELTSIQHTSTPNGRDQWDTPEEKLPGGKKGRQRKDRYSSLMLANWASRVIGTFEQVHYDFITSIQTDTNRAYEGPAWYADIMDDFIKNT